MRGRKLPDNTDGIGGHGALSGPVDAADKMGHCTVHWSVCPSFSDGPLARQGDVGKVPHLVIVIVIVRHL